MEVDESKKCSTVKGRFGPVRFDFNPVVTFLSALVIWGSVIWCIVRPEEAK